MTKPKLRGVMTAIVGIIVVLAVGKALHLGPHHRLGDRAENILAGATRVQTFRVMSPAEARGQASGHLPPTLGPTTPQIDGCYITATAKEQGPALAHQISNILFDDWTYTSRRLACITLPGVIFRIWNGSQSLDLVVCFHCGEMYTVSHDASGNSYRGVYTVLTGISRAEFARLAKAAFPNDADIQAL